MNTSGPRSSDPYGFIMDAGTPAPKSKLPIPMGSTSKNGRILIVIIGAVILAIIAAIVMAFLSSGGDQTIKDVTKLAQEQNELIRIADIGAKKAKGTEAQNLALTTKFTITSDQKQTLEYLSTQRHKVSSSILKATKNTQTDNALTVAAQNNNFDETFIKTIGSMLISYKSDVSKTYNDATARPNAKKLMTTLYNNINTLSTQVKGATEASN